MVEYDKHPGRVFLLAQRDLQPNEEVFVLYGPKYWGFTSYHDLQQSVQMSSTHSRRKRFRNGNFSTSAWNGDITTSTYYCRSCG